MKVNNKEIKVELPKLLLKTVLKPNEFTKPSAKMHSKLGQSIPIVSQRIKLPKNIKRTCRASWLNGPIGGRTLPMKHKITQIGIIV